MENYKYGVHADLEKLGDLNRTGSLDNVSSSDKWAYELHFIPISGFSSDFASIVDDGQGARGFAFGTGQRFEMLGFSAQQSFVLNNAEFPLIAEYSKYRFRVEVDNSGQDRVITLYFDNGVDPMMVVDASSFDGSLTKNAAEINRGGDEYLLSKFIIQKDEGNGWEDAHVFDPAQVRDGSGNLVPRGDASAEAGADGKIYDLLSTVTFDSSVVDSTAFPSVYDIVDVNGGAIELGQSFTVQMSNAITVDDVYFKSADGTGNEYHPTFSVSGDTITGSVPLSSDDTIPMFGTMTMHVVSGADTFTKDFEFTAPEGMTVVTLQDPIELDESSYSYSTGLNPADGDFYFHQPTSDFSITENNVWQPVGDAPWSNTVWYLSGAGLRETEAVDGQQVLVLPTATIETQPQTVEAGATIQLAATVTNADTISWSTSGGGTFTDATVEDAEFIAGDGGEVETLTLSATNGDGTVTATVDITVNVVAVIPTISISATPTTVTVGDEVTVSYATTDADSVALSANLAGAFNGDVFTTAEAGTLIITGTATSSTGDTEQDTVQVAVEEADATRPVITVDTTPIVVEYGGQLTLPTATASDDIDGDLTDQIIIDNPVNVNQLGSYTVTYSGPEDSSGNVAEPVTISVTVVDTTDPSIELIGDAVQSVAQDATYTDPGATVTDNVDGVVTITGTGVVDTSSPGQYTLSYNYTDTSGNQAVTVTRTVNVMADYSDVVETVAQVSTWAITDDNKIHAFSGRSNREKFSFTPSDVSGIIVTADGKFDFSAPYFDKLEIKMNGNIISTDTDSVIIIDDGAGVAARLGDMTNGSAEQGYMSFILYVGGDTRGTVIGSQTQNGDKIKLTVSTV